MGKIGCVDALAEADEFPFDFFFFILTLLLLFFVFIVLQRCKRVWGDNSKLVMDLIDATDESTILEHNMHVRHADSLSQGHWGKGRVTLVGDAAHPMRPASGAHCCTASLHWITQSPHCNVCIAQCCATQHYLG